MHLAITPVSQASVASPGGSRRAPSAPQTPGTSRARGCGTCSVPAHGFSQDSVCWFQYSTLYQTSSGSPGDGSVLQRTTSTERPSLATARSSVPAATPAPTVPRDAPLTSRPPESFGPDTRSPSRRRLSRATDTSTLLLSSCSRCRSVPHRSVPWGKIVRSGARPRQRCARRSVADERCAAGDCPLAGCAWTALLATRHSIPNACCHTLVVVFIIPLLGRFPWPTRTFRCSCARRCAPPRFGPPRLRRLSLHKTQRLGELCGSARIFFRLGPRGVPFGPGHRSSSAAAARTLTCRRAEEAGARGG